MNGLEWIVEAHGCDPAALAQQGRLEELFELIVVAMDLHALGKTKLAPVPQYRRHHGREPAHRIASGLPYVS